jgi:3-phosphoshikimate 1-carboxyvinyltransferase
LPTLAVLAAVADGVSELRGIARARIKESNRAAAMSEGLRRMGIAVTEEEDRMLITGGGARGAEIDPRQDHRIAMAFSVLATVTGKTVVNDAECVAKTYPDYWEVLQKTGGEVSKDE